MRTAIVSNLLKYYSLLCKNIFRLSPMIRSEIVSIPVLKDSFPTSQRLCFNLGATACIKPENNYFITAILSIMPPLNTGRQYSN